jgi:hypothetical protein
MKAFLVYSWSSAGFAKSRVPRSVYIPIWCLLAKRAPVSGVFLGECSFVFSRYLVLFLFLFDAEWSPSCVFAVKYYVFV